MQQFIFRPHPALQAIVSSIAIMDITFNQDTYRPSYHYPWSAQIRLCFYIKGDLISVKKKKGDPFTLLGSSFVVGPQLSNTYLNFGREMLTVAVSFRAGGLQRLTGIPINLLLNQEIEASVIFGPGIALVERQLQDAADPKAIAEILDRFLLQRLSRAKEIQPFDYAISELVEQHGNIGIEKTASLSCLSKRQFERKCMERLGMSPKLFANLVRFSRAYMYKECHPLLPWIKIAHEFGYYDQMHLIHDFKRFAGYAPSVAVNNLSESLKLVNLFEQGA